MWPNSPTFSTGASTSVNGSWSLSPSRLKSVGHRASTRPIRRPFTRSSVTDPKTPGGVFDQLPPDFFSSQHHEGPDSRSILRFLHYPAIPAGANVEPNRAGAHSDYGSLTLLFQRKSGGEGLQILPPSEPLEGGTWRETGIVDDALLVNVGDALELWSGARFKSTLHRVREVSHDSWCRNCFAMFLTGAPSAGGPAYARTRGGDSGALLNCMVQPADPVGESEDLRGRDVHQRECAPLSPCGRLGPSLTTVADEAT